MTAKTIAAALARDPVLAQLLEVYRVDHRYHVESHRWAHIAEAFVEGYVVGRDVGYRERQALLDQGE